MSKVTRHTENGFFQRCQKKLTVTALAVCLSVMAFGAVQAQTQIHSVRDMDADLFFPLVIPDEFAFVGTRPQAEFDATGHRAASFVFYPKVEVEEIYRTNIYRSANNEKSDSVTVVRPHLKFQSDWNQHELIIQGGAAAGFYKEYNEDNFIDLYLSASNRLDISKAVTMRNNAAIMRQHEERGATDVPLNADEAVTYNVAVLDSSTIYKPGALGIGAVVRGKYYDFNDVKLTTNQKRSNNDRDRLELAYGVQLSYDIKPEHQVYVEALRTDRKYDVAQDRNGFVKDSDGYQFNLGTKLELSPVLNADISVGHVRTQFKDTRFDTIKDIRAAAVLNWNISPLTTMRFRLARDVRETSLAGASSVIQTYYGISLDHELRRNIILGLDLTTMRENFQGIAQNEKTHTVGIRADYRFNQRWFTRGSYHYSTRSSNAATRDYNDNRFMLSIGTNF